MFLHKIKKLVKMKTLIIFLSIYHGNTEKIAKAMAEVLDAGLMKLSQVNLVSLPTYNLIGFGSGIYFGEHHKSLLTFADKIPVLKGKKAFIFSTSGVSNKLNFLHNILHRTAHFHNPLKENLLRKGFDIIGEFSCRGFDIVGPFKLVGGINKDRPNEEDLKRAKNFVKELKNKRQSLIKE